MKRFILTTSIALISTLTFANTEIQLKQQALDVMQRYASTIACDGDDTLNTDLEDRTTLKDVFKVRNHVELDTPTYYVFWAGDKHCIGGSGSWTYYISEIYLPTHHSSLIVLNDNAFNFGEDETWFEDEKQGKSNILPKFIKSIEQISPYEFNISAEAYPDSEFGGHEYFENDTPPHIILFNLKFNEQRSKWQIVNRQLVGVPADGPR